VPTGFIDRNLVLVVTAREADGKEVRSFDGPRLPEISGSVRGQSGRLYAKELKDTEGRSPVPFWRPGSTVEDTRLSPGQPDNNSWMFPGSVRSVQARLLYRKSWPEVARAKSWPDNEVEVGALFRELEP
jgi:hypothetical protein